MKFKVKHKRGIPFPTHIVFSAVSLLVQIAFFIIMVYGLSEHFFFVNTLSMVMGIATVFYIINRKGNPSYKILWIIFILVAPVFGVTSFMLLGGGRVMPHLKKKMNICEDKYKKQLPDDADIHETLRYSDGMHSRQAIT